MTDTEKAYWLGFSAFPGIGPVRFSLLVKYFGNAKNAWLAGKNELLSTGLTNVLVDRFLDFRRKFCAERFLELLNRKNIQFLTRSEAQYPEILKNITDPPIGLYLKGNIDLLTYTKPFIGVVGSRKPSGYGRQATEKIVTALAYKGFVIISGLAYGIDAFAHKYCLNANGLTVAVMGCGADIVHPAANTALYQEILAKRGTIVSEYPPGYLTNKGLFPARNRIISGLSKAVLVIEGVETSGSLITARLAVEQGRDVYAVPGSIFSEMSQGPMKLIKQGAKLVNRVDDILEEFDLSPVSNTLLQKSFPTSLSDLKGLEKEIWQLLCNNDMYMDELAKIIARDVKEVAIAVTSLQLKGFLVTHADGKLSAGK